MPTLLLPWFIIVFRTALAEESGTIVVEEERDQIDDAGGHTTRNIDEFGAGHSDLGEVLGTVPGVYVRRLGGLGEYSSVSIRGSSGRQSTVYLNGIPLNPEGVSTINLSELPLHAFDTLSVYRSNYPLSFQSSSIGGVLNLETKSDPGWQLTTSAGSFQSLRLLGFVSGASDQGTTHLFLDSFQTEGNYTYFDDNQTLYNQDDDQYRQRQNNNKWQSNLLWHHQTGNWNFLFSGLQRQEGIPWSTATTATKIDLLSKRALSGLQWNRVLSNQTHQATFWHLFRTETLDDSLGELSGTPRWYQTTAQSVGLRSYHQFLLHSPIVPSLGLSARWEQATAAEDPNLQNLSYDRIVLQPQLGAVWLSNSEQWQLLMAIQGHLLSNTESAKSVQTTAITPRASLIWRASDRSALWSTVHKAFRPPDLIELFGDRGVLVGNPDLLPEQSTTVDAGTSLALPRHGLSFQGATFYRRSTDAIIIIQNAQRLATYMNFSDTQVYGVETALAWDQIDWLMWEGNLTWNHSVNRSPISSLEGKALPNVPTWVAQQHTTLRSQLVQCRYSWYFVDGNYWDAVNRYDSPSRLLHNASLRIHQRGNRPQIDIDARNLSNRITETVALDPLQPALGNRQQSVGDFSGFPLPGRSVFLSLTWNNTPTLEAL